MKGKASKGSTKQKQAREAAPEAIRRAEEHRNDWAFLPLSAQVDENERKAWITYELARESPSIRATVARLREAEKGQKADAERLSRAGEGKLLPDIRPLIAHNRATDVLMKLLRGPYWLQQITVPGFPTTPWLSLPPEQKLPPKERNRAGFAAYIEPFESAQSPAFHTGMYGIGKALVRHQRIFVLGIDVTATRHLIREAVAEELERLFEELKIPEGKGPNEVLNHISALRLRRLVKQPWTLHSKLKGAPPFGERYPVWHRASQQVKEHLHSAFDLPPDEEPLSTTAGVWS